MSAGSRNDGSEAAGQFGFVDLPVTQTRGVIVTGMAVAEPAVVEKEELPAHVCGVVDEPHEPVTVERERSGLPVVHHDRPQLVAVAHGVSADPAVEAAREGAHSIGRPHPDLLGCDEGCIRVEHVFG